MPQALLEASLDLPLLARGKVRDIYAIDANDPASPLLFIATDRISAFDHVLGSPIPEKGRILTQLSLFWFHFLEAIVPNHLLSADLAAFPPIHAQARTPDGVIETLDRTVSLPSALEGRTTLVKRARMFPVECVVRGYLSGSGWKDYQASARTGQPSVCGVALPHGLKESDRLPEPIFTPAAKINTGGHDENISFATVVQTLGEENANRLRDLSMAIYRAASAHAATRGIILADTKFEFGVFPEPGGAPQIILCDEVLTPDSSRYWPADLYQPGGPTPSFDKQYVRDYLESIHWNKQVPAPPLPDTVVENTRAKYMQAYQLLTGQTEL